MSATDSPPSPLQILLGLLDLETIEVNVFRGASPKDRSQRVFGGQVLAQALVAANRTIEGRVCHSLHAFFLLPGDPKVPILYEVDRSRDGKSFSSRRVVAIQHGRPIFHMAASFQIEEAGLEHEVPPPPDVPPPEDLPADDAFRREMADRVPEAFRENFLRKGPIELRPVARGDLLRPEKRPPRQAIWVRATGP
jgi:acyl-CoA thioesterase-2